MGDSRLRDLGDIVLYHLSFAILSWQAHDGFWGRWADRPVLVQVKQPASRGPLGHPQIRRSGTKQVSEFKPNRKPAHAETYKGMHLLQSGVSLDMIRDFLGHVDAKTTQIYARANLEMKRNAPKKNQ